MALSDPSIVSLDRSVASLHGSSGDEKVCPLRIPARSPIMLIKKKNLCKDTWGNIFSRLPLKSLFGCRCVSRSWRSLIDNPDFAHLNLTLWAKILSRLPIETLVRFRCVSKSWCALLNDPDFARLHLNQFNNSNVHESPLFFVQVGNREAECVVRCSKTLRVRARLGSLQSLKMSITTFGRNSLRHVPVWDILCSIDGLYMLKAIAPTTAVLMLWNPSIRKARTLPPRSQIPERGLKIVGRGLRYFDLGLGFDLSIKDYKHVRLLVEVDMDSVICLHSAAVYTVGTSSWRTIKFQGQGCSSSRWVSFSFNPNAIASLKGVLYFIGKTISKDSELVSFDLSSEMFASTTFPKDPNFTDLDGLTLVDGGSSLGAVLFLATHGSIWVLESDFESQSWTKRYTFPLRIPTFHPDILFLSKSGNILLDHNEEVTSYNVQTHNENIVLRKKNHSLHIPSARGYMDSLILLN